MSGQPPPNNAWPAVAALALLLLFIAFLIWILVT